MSATEDIDDDSIDEVIHADNMLMDMFFEFFYVFIVEINRFESFRKKFGINLLFGMVSMFFLLFEYPKQRSEILVLFFQKEKKYNKHNKYNNTQEYNNSSHYFLLQNKHCYTIYMRLSIKTQTKNFNSLISVVVWISWYRLSLIFYHDRIFSWFTRYLPIRDFLFYWISGWLCFSLSNFQKKYILKIFSTSADISRKTC